MKEPPETEAERLRLTSTLHALDHAARLMDILADGGPAAAPEDPRASELCQQALRAAEAVGRSITAECALSAQAIEMAGGCNLSQRTAQKLSTSRTAA